MTRYAARPPAAGTSWPNTPRCTTAYATARWSSPQPWTNYSAAHPPVLTFRPTATQSKDLAGTHIREGARVVVFRASANHDDRVFPDPFAPDLARSPNPHISFGDGPHFCLGAHFARLQLPS